MCGHPVSQQVRPLAHVLGGAPRSPCFLNADYLLAHSSPTQSILFLRPSGKWPQSLPWDSSQAGLSLKACGQRGAHSRRPSPSERGRGPDTTVGAPGPSRGRENQAQMNPEGNTREGDLKGTEASGSQELGWRRGQGGPAPSHGRGEGRGAQWLCGLRSALRALLLAPSPSGSPNPCTDVFQTSRQQGGLTGRGQMAQGKPSTQAERSAKLRSSS